MPEEYKQVDILKAIGIISVIVGHSMTVLPITGLQITRFVYLYHIMVFFFVSGFSFNDKKYEKNVASYYGNRISKLVVLYFLYNLGFVLIHNLLCRLYILPSGTEYSVNDAVIWICSGLLLNTNESMLGAFWFVPVFLTASLLFGIIFELYCRAKKRKSVIVFFCLLNAVIGLYTNHMGMMLVYHMQTALIAVPIMFIGWITKKYYSKIENLFNWKICLVCAAILIIFIHSGSAIELSINQTGDAWFYPITIVGLVFCMALSNVLLKLPNAAVKVLSFIGQNSFHFMALHFLSFKIIDIIITVVKNASSDLISVFPHSYELGLIYPVVTILLISLSIVGIKKGIKVLDRIPT